MLFFVFKKFVLGLKVNLQEEDNLSTGGKWPHCVLCLEVLLCTPSQCNVYTSKLEVYPLSKNVYPYTGIHYTHAGYF